MQAIFCTAIEYGSLIFVDVIRGYFQFVFINASVDINEA